MRTRLLAFLLLAGAASGQTLLTPTNTILSVMNDPAYTLEGVAGAYRITYTVESTAGVPLNLDDGTHLRLYVWGADGHLVSSNIPSAAPEAPLSAGKVKFLFNNINAGTYRMRGIATPVSGDTNENWNFTHHTMTVTNPPSAGGGSLGNLTVQWEIQGDGDLAPDATDRTISPHTDGGSDLGRSDERFREVHAITARVGRLFVAGDADVGGTLSALDNSRVLRVGETNEVILTGTQVRVRYPVDPPDATSKEYVDAVAGGAANMGTVQIYTNANREVGYTNSAGYFTVLRNGLPTATPTKYSQYDSDAEITSNKNLGTLTYYTTNSALVMTLPNESGALRIVDYTPIVNTGTWLRAAVFVKHGVGRMHQLAVQQVYSGIAWQRTDGTNFLFGADYSVNNAPRMLNIEFSAAYARGVYPVGLTPYEIGTASVYFWQVGASPNGYWYGMDFDGTNILREYVGASTEYMQLVGVLTNAVYTGVDIAGVGVGVGSYAAGAGRTTNSQYVVDSFVVEEGALWRNPLLLP